MYLAWRPKVGHTQPCTWMNGYLTDEMFTRNKPFYQSFGIQFKIALRVLAMLSRFSGRCSESLVLPMLAGTRSEKAAPPLRK